MLEEHGAGKQLFRVRSWPHVPVIATGLFVVLACVAAVATYEKELLAGLPLGLAALAIAALARADCARGMRSWRAVAQDYFSDTEKSASGLNSSQTGPAEGLLSASPVRATSL